MSKAEEKEKAFQDHLRTCGSCNLSDGRITWCCPKGVQLRQEWYAERILESTGEISMVAHIDHDTDPL